MSSREQKQREHSLHSGEMRRVRKEIRRGREQKKHIRHKDWLPSRWDDPESLDLPSGERVVPRGERERRRNVWAAALGRLQQQADQSDEAVVDAAPAADGLTGIVVEVSSGLCRVRANGDVLLCSIRGALGAAEEGLTHTVAVGDRVTVTVSGRDQGVIERIWPRRSALTRPDVFYGHLQQVVVANADQLLVVASWRQPHFWPELVDRYLIAAQRNGLKAVLCVNKVDLAEDRAACEKELWPYRRLGYGLLFTSAVTGEGIAGLRDLLQGQITALAGLSGVGKSSLLAAVQPGLDLRVGQVSDWGDGRHTTTQVNLIELEMGGYVADTPGIREFGLSGLQRSELAQFYPEIATAGRRCRFANCAHLSEPGCAIQEAVRCGQVSAMRYQSYRSIYGALSE